VKTPLVCANDGKPSAKLIIRSILRLNVCVSTGCKTQTKTTVRRECGTEPWKYYPDVDEVEESIFRVPMATRETERVLRLGDILTLGAARGIFTGLSPDGSVYLTVDHGDVDVYAVDVKLP
jgi:hypothetical protein